MSKVLFFLISGKAGVGKTFTADIIKEAFSSRGYTVAYKPFAEAVKNTARFMGWNGKKDSSGRKLLQVIGQAGREYDENLWVNKVLESIHNMDFYPDVVIVDDWRFPNEFARAKDDVMFKIVSLRIIAPEREILKDSPELYNEVSETSLDAFEFFDYCIENPVSTPDNLSKSLEEILALETLKNRRH